MRIDAFGNQISYWIWPAEEPMPSEPIATVTDGRVSSGGPLWLYAASDTPPDFAEFVSAEFLFARAASEPITFYEPIPEPAGKLMIHVVAVSCLLMRRPRRSLECLDRLGATSWKDT